MARAVAMAIRSPRPPERGRQTGARAQQEGYNPRPDRPEGWRHRKGVDGRHRLAATQHQGRYRQLGAWAGDSPDSFSTTDRVPASSRNPRRSSSSKTGATARRRPPRFASKSMPRVPVNLSPRAAIRYRVTPRLDGGRLRFHQAQPPERSLLRRATEADPADRPETGIGEAMYCRWSQPCSSSRRRSSSVRVKVGTP